MNNEIEQIQIELSKMIHEDIIKIATTFSNYSIVNFEETKELLIHIHLLHHYNVKYIHNEELTEVMNILTNEFKNSSQVINLTLYSSFEYLLEKETEFEKFLFVQIFFKVPSETFANAFPILNIVSQNVQGLYDKMTKYIFNFNFLNLDENLQIDCLYKGWNLSLQFFHDNSASQYAYKKLLPLFHQALHYKKTEVAFWLYYTPMHYFKSGTASDINISNEEFKNEVEKPLEKYILDYIVPKYNIQENKKTINKDRKIKIAFVMQRIVRHSTVNVFYSLVKSLMENKDEKYEFILYDLSFTESGGSQVDFVEEFKDLGIKYINVHQKIFGNNNPTYSLLEKCIKTREILIKDNIDILIGLHTRIEYIFLYATRTAPKQIYWYHSSNAQYDIKGIDKIINHCEEKENFEKFNIEMDTNKFHTPKVSKKDIQQEREKYPKNAFIIGTIGRLVKLSDQYLDSIEKIMQKNTNVIYIAAGIGDKDRLIKKVTEKNLIERFYFPGFVDPHVYGYIIDFIPDTFPINQGESLQEFMNKKEQNSFVTLKSKKFMDFHKQHLDDISKQKEKEIALIDTKYKEALSYIYSTYGSNYNNLTDDIEKYIQLCNYFINDEQLRKYANYCHINYLKRIHENSFKQFTSILDKL